MGLEIRRSVRWARSSREWRVIGQSVLIVAALALSALVVFKPQADRFCDQHKVGCSLGTGFVSTGVVFLVGYVVLFLWTIRKAQSYYVSLARNTPDRLMPTPTNLRASEIVGREQLTETIAKEVAFARNGAPILVVGEAGSGRTTFLLRLTQHLAQAGWIPVDVSLRRAQLPLSFRAFAQDEFLRRIDPIVRNEADAERIWRKLCARGAIVVLADGLDEVALEFPRHERDHVIRAALLNARNEQLAVVATCRPETIPFGAAASAFELAPLDEDEAFEYLAKRITIKKPEKERLREVMSAGQITHSPFYLNVLADLHRLEKLPENMSPSKESLLVELLESWVCLLETEKLRPEVEFRTPQRQRIVRGLSKIGYAMTLASSAESKLSRLDDDLTKLSGPTRDPPHRLGQLRRRVLDRLPRAHQRGEGVGDTDTALIIEGASQLGLIDTQVHEKDIGLRFPHAITQAYFASRYLRHESDARDRLLDEVGTEALEAVLMWGSKSAKDAAATAAALLARAEHLDPDSALTFAVSAHHLSGIGGSSPLATKAAETIEGMWEHATPRCRLAAVRRLDGRGDSDYRILHSATGDANYRVRWAAAHAIIAGGSNAYAALKNEFAGTLARAERAQWTDKDTHDISVLGWILPAIRGTVDQTAAMIDSQLERLTRLVLDGRRPPGTEASLAQGFKIRALNFSAAGTVADATALLPKCRFWYSRIELLHAICLAGISNPHERRAALAAIRSAAAKDEEHPFVREAARLSAKALRLSAKALKEREWRRYIWEDESSLISQSGSTLAPETTVLVSDVVLLLNLTEQGPKHEVEHRKDETYPLNELPYCLGRSRDRSKQLFDDCDERCTFVPRLCPYPLSAELVQARGAFSQAFCEYQIELLARRRRWRMPIRSKRTGSWSRTSRAARKRFWETMQRRAL